MQSGRLVTQDYPHTLQDRQIAQRYRLVDSLIDFAESSRLSNQDSEPPTPKRATAQEDPTELVTMKDFFKDGSRRNASLAANPAFEELQLVGYGNHGAAQGNGAAQGESKEGTLRKIKSSIRRKSLGPKSATGPGQSLRYQLARRVGNRRRRTEGQICQTSITLRNIRKISTSLLSPCSTQIFPSAI